MAHSVHGQGAEYALVGNSRSDSLDEEEKTHAAHANMPHRISYFKILLWVSLCAVVLVACLGILMGTTILALHESYQAQIAGNPGNGEVLTTSEYQISFPKPFTWKDREELVAEWMEVWAEKSSFFSQSQPSVSTTVRHQYFVDMSGRSSCRSGDRLRVRVYEKSDSKNGYSTGTTVDIKGNANSKDGAMNKPYWPASGLHAQQKMEKDYHGCSLKYSRESRVYLDDKIQFTSCGDISRLFPWALKDKYDQNRVSEYQHEYWWVRQYNGYLDGDTMYSIAFTLRYPTVEGARKQRDTANTGEWSIRIFGVEDGKSEIYNEDVVQDTREAWKALATHFGREAC